MPMRILAFLIVLGSGPAWAEMPASGRYQLLAVSGGFVRLDTVTGAMTYCRDEVDKFGCAEMSTDESRRQQPVKPSEGDIGDTDEDFAKALSMAEKAFRSFMAIAKEQKSEECTL